MATSKSHHYPMYRKGKSYDLFKAELLLWAAATDLPEEKQGPAIALFSLPENDESMIHEKVMRELTVPKLKEKKGLDNLIEFLDKHLGRDSLEEAWSIFEEFEDYKRSDESIVQYIANFDQKYRRLESSAGMTVPPAILAFKLLKQANLSRDEMLVTMTGLDFSKKDDLYTDAKAALKKYKGGIISGGSGTSQQTAIKVEEAYVSGFNEGRRQRGRGRGYGRGQYTNAGRGQKSTYYDWRSRSPGNSAGNSTGNSTGNYGKSAGYKPRRPLNALGENGEHVTCNVCDSYRHVTKDCKDGGNAMNFRGDDGEPLRCSACGSCRHFMRDCDNSWEKINARRVHFPEKVNLTEDSEKDRLDMPSDLCLFTDSVCLFTGNDKSSVSLLGHEANGSAVLDSACTSNVCGQGWFQDYISSLNETDRADVLQTAGDKVFEFGGGTRLKSTGSFYLPAYVVGHRVKICVDVVESDIPLLLSKPAMKKAKVKMNYENDTAEILGKVVELNCTSSGHYCIPITKPIYEDIYAVNSVELILAVKLSDQSVTERKKTFVKLHRQFGHPATNSLVRLLKDAGIWEDEYSSELEMLEDCNRCKEYRRNKPRPVVALPAARCFNEKIAMDLKKWDVKWILHMIDMWSRFTLSVFVDRKHSSGIIDKVMKHWIGTFGVMQAIMTDNGGEFCSDEMKDVCSVLNVEIVTSAAESPFQNGLCEKVHSITDGMLLKLVADNPKAKVKVLLRWANMARNSLQMWCGYSSHQLVFGVNPNLPNIMTDNLAALDGSTSSMTFAEHINYLAECRKAFIACEADERIRRALRNKIRTSEEIYNPGDRVFYKREKSVRWMGPAKVIFQDGKVVFVRHGDIFVKVSPTRLQKAGSEFGPSNEKTEIENLNPEESDISQDERWKIVDEDTQTEPIENLGNLDVAVEHESDNEDTRTEDPPRRSLRLFNKESGFPVYETFIATVPRNQQNNPECQAAKNIELQKLVEFKVYEEVPFEGQECISTRWVLWHKGDEIRARLVARGFEEQVCVEKDSPTVGKVAVRLFLTLSASKSWIVKTTDIKSAFLQGKPIDRDVFLTPPKEAAVNSGNVWKLKRCLYGLNDAARKFYDSVVEELKRLGCKQSMCDPAMFYFKKDAVLCGIVVSHIDDFLHAGNNAFETEVMDRLRARFVAGKLLDSSFSYVGFHVKQNVEGIVLDQSAYVEDLKVPLVPADRMTRKEDELNGKEYTLFRSVVGSLNWLAHGTRPDILFDLIDLSMRFNKAVIGDLMRAVKIARKLKDVTSSLYFPALVGATSEWKFVVYTDAALGNLPDGHSSTAAHITFLVDRYGNCCTLAWRANKIKRVVRSTLAAEALSLQEGIEESCYLSKMIQELLDITVPIHAYIDNQSTIDAVNSTKMVENKKLRIDIAAIKQNMTDNTVTSLSWVPDKDQLANSMTKKGASNFSLLAVLQSGTLPDLPQ